MTVSCSRLRAPPSGYNFQAVGTKRLQSPKTVKAESLEDTETFAVLTVNKENLVDNIKKVGIC